VTEILFYHLQDQSLERVLPTLLEKSLERGWRVIVQSSSDERVDALDAHLWTYNDSSFLPHGTVKGGDAADQPILLTMEGDNRNSANVRFLVDGTPLPEDAENYDRIVLIFDGDDEEAVVAARTHWTTAKERGLAATYWQPDEQGRWVKKA
jgi:DNA polymerase-3 subunit chi